MGKVAHTVDAYDWTHMHHTGDITGHVHLVLDVV